VPSEHNSSRSTPIATRRESHKKRVGRYVDESGAGKVDVLIVKPRDVREQHGKPATKLRKEAKRW
jgi:hypothetical protein